MPYPRLLAMIAPCSPIRRNTRHYDLSGIAVHFGMARPIRKSRADKRQRELEERLKLAGGTCHTYALALMAAAFVEPLTKGEPMSTLNLLFIGGAVVLHAIALYLAPMGKVTS